MRNFSSYGPVDKDMHYYVPRTELVNTARKYLLGKNPEKGGHYIIVWASRQCGKSWLLREIYWELQKNDNYYVANIDIQNLTEEPDSIECMNEIIYKINSLTKLQLPDINELKMFEKIFTSKYISKPLILIIDEFDALEENVIKDIVGAFRNIYNSRIKDTNPAPEKEYLLHGVALIGVRSVVGVENKTGSPFNVQKSLHISNLTETEVNEMFHWYEKDSEQKIEQAVIDRIYYVTQGQPGLVSWFGEILTEDRFNKDKSQIITMKQWKRVYSAALQILPNNQILNILSKVKTDPYRKIILELFKTDNKIKFNFEDTITNYLYMNGVINYEEDISETENKYLMKFPFHFIQEKLFGYFSRELVKISGLLLADPFINLKPIINKDYIDIRKLLGLYQEYFTLNREYILKNAMKRVDLQVKEVVFHFQLFSWLNSFLSTKDAKVLPEFPTGNGKIDLLIHHNNKMYGIELKSFTDLTEIENSIKQASAYGKALKLNTITLVIFVDRELPENIENEYAKSFIIENSATVDVVFIMTGKKNYKDKIPD